MKIKKTTLRPCDVTIFIRPELLYTQGTGINGDSIRVTHGYVELELGNTTLKINHKLFKDFSEWYLEEQQVEPYYIQSNSTNIG